MESNDNFEQTHNNSYPHKKNENLNEKYKIVKKSGPFSYNCLSYGENTSFKLTFELIEDNIQEDNDNKAKQYIEITAIPYANKENYKDRDSYIHGVKKSFTLNKYKEKFDFYDFRNICEKYSNLKGGNMIQVFNEMIKSIKENKSKININKFHLLFSYCISEFIDFNNIITLSLDNENEYNILECYEDANQKAFKTHNNFYDKNKIQKNQGKKLNDLKNLKNIRSMSHSKSPISQNSNKINNNLNHNNTELLNSKEVQNKIPDSQDKNKNSNQNKRGINQVRNNLEENNMNIESNDKNMNNNNVNKGSKIPKPRNKSMAPNLQKQENKIEGKKEKKNSLINQNVESNKKKERKIRNETLKDKNDNLVKEKKISEENKTSPSKEQKSKITKNFIYGDLYGENNFPKLSPLEDKNNPEKMENSEKNGKKEEKAVNTDKNKNKENDNDDSSEWGSSFFDNDFDEDISKEKEESKEKVEKEKKNEDLNKKEKQKENENEKEQFIVAKIQNNKEDGEIESDIEPNNEDSNKNLLGHKHNIEKESEKNPCIQKGKKITPEKMNKINFQNKSNECNDLNGTPVITIIESDDEGNSDKNEYKNNNEQNNINFEGKYKRNNPQSYSNYINNNYEAYNKNNSNPPAPINMSYSNNNNFSQNISKYNNSYNQRNMFQNNNRAFLRYFSEPSNIIHNMREILLIKDKIEKSNDLYFKLVYSSLRDKDDYITFKNAVIDKYRHLILVKTTKGRRFAIYFNEKLFSLTGKQNLDKIDMMGFIFSFDKYMFYEPKERMICFTQSPSNIYLFRLSDYSIYIKNNFKSTIHHFGQSCKIFNIKNLYDELNGGEEEYNIDILEVYHTEIPNK